MLLGLDEVGLFFSAVAVFLAVIESGFRLGRRQVLSTYLHWRNIRAREKRLTSSFPQAARAGVVISCHL
jgi:hypothetical protein